MYYLQSRYYDPTTGRFLNADNAELLGANGDFTSLNLFAYCGNNPVSRADDGGGFWHIVIGAAVGVLSQYVSDVVFNLASGSSLSEAFIPTSSAVDYLAAAAGGALAASGVGAFGAAIGNAAIDGLAYVANCGIEGKQVDETEFLLTVTTSAVTSSKGIDGARLRSVYKHAKGTLKTAVSATKVSMYVAKKTQVVKTVVGEVVVSLLDGIKNGLYRDFKRRLVM